MDTVDLLTLVYLMLLDYTLGRGVEVGEIESSISHWPQIEVSVGDGDLSVSTQTRI